jgi:hypothetical protein
MQHLLVLIYDHLASPVYLRITPNALYTLLCNDDHPAASRWTKAVALRDWSKLDIERINLKDTRACYTRTPHQLQLKPASSQYVHTQAHLTSYGHFPNVAASLYVSG